MNPLNTLRACLAAAALIFATTTSAQTPEAVKAKVDAQVNPLLGTLKELVSIESGSRDLEGLTQLSQVVAGHLKASGMGVQILPARAPEFHPQLKGAPVGSMVYATRTGTGQRKVHRLIQPTPSM